MSEENQNTEEDNWVNPIDPDKVAENPHNLPYAHTVSGPVIKPEDKGKIKGRALAAMEQQTNMQLDQIKEQMNLLAQQARDLQDRVEISNIIYDAEIGFTPLIGHEYHLYKKDNGKYVMSMIAPSEWGRSPKYAEFVASVNLLADHTWHVVEQDSDF